MKVIKASIDLSKWTVAVTCPKCNSELELVSKDISYDYEYGKTPYIATCCLCDGRITLAETKIPEIVKTDINKHRYISHGSAWD